MPHLHVVIPFFNEQQTLDQCVRRVVRAPLPEHWTRRLVLVDDSSRDAAQRAAADLVVQVRAAGAEIALLRHDVNLGKGAALRTGFDHVLAHASESDAVVIQDADLEYDPADFAALLVPLIEDIADAVYGTRWGEHRPSGGVTPRLHRLGNRALTFASNAMTGLRLTDMECCYKVLTVAVLRRLRPMLTENRFGIEPQITAGLARLGCRVAEVPVRYEPRGFEAGKKIGWRDGVRALVVIARERRRRSSPVGEGGAADEPMNNVSR